MSTDVTLEEITRAMGRKPDSGRSKGEALPYSNRRRPFSQWAIDIPLDKNKHPGTEALSAGLEALGEELAARANDLSHQGCDVAVSVLQELTEDEQTHGFHLTVQAIKWMAAANAELDIDQYILDADDADACDSQSYGEPPLGR